MNNASPPMTAPFIEFWFEFGSSYSYLSTMRIEEAAARRGVEVHWKPFLLGPIFRGLGWDTSPFVVQKAKGAYVAKDMERQCHKYGLPWAPPSTFPRRALLPLRVALVGADQAWMGGYCRHIMSLNFACDRDIDSPPVVAEALKHLRLPAREIMDAAQSEGNKSRLRQQTEAAAARGIFGAPTFFAGGEMFWGNDRLDDALAWCVRGLE